MLSRLATKTDTSKIEAVHIHTPQLFVDNEVEALKRLVAPK